MFSKKETVSIVLCSIFVGFALSFWHFLSASAGVIDEANFLFIFLVMFLFIFLIILINSCAKKVAAYYFDSDLEVRIWEIKRWGYRPSNYFKTPLMAGIIFPLMTSFLSVGYFTWLAPLVFDCKENKYRVSKRHGYNSFFSMNEFHIGAIAAFGLIANLFFAYIGYLIGYHEFSRLSLCFVFFNIIPFSDLDGAKILFGNVALWVLMFVVSLIGLLLALLVF